MRKELFGVFGDEATFRRFRSPTEFDAVVSGPGATVGVRDVGHRIPGRTATYEDDRGACAVWGEVYHPDDGSLDVAHWLLDAYAQWGTDALGALNGSYVAFVDYEGDAFVATDPARTWECYYTDAPGVRTFGTDPTAVADVVPSPTVATDPLMEFVHIGVVLGDRTTLEEVKRTPFDGRLHEDDTSELRRFVYDPCEFDYAGELARRIENAIERRARLPGRKGLLLSGGYDSRTILARMPDLDVCYTVGPPGSAEVEVGRQLAAQYGVDHRALTADERYLNTNQRVIQYGHGIRESIHIHHAAFDAEMDVDTMYHGLLWDTFFRGHFLPQDHVEVLGHEIPLNRVDPDPDVAETLIERKFGYISASDRFDLGCETTPRASKEFARDAIERQLDGLQDRCDSIHNAIELLGIRNQPALSFRHHLADRYLESFVAADADLIDWHLRTPPEYRNVDTVLEAMRRIDPEILRHRPPNRPYDSRQLNQIQSFLRRKMPFVESANGSWPDRATYYDRKQLDSHLFPDHPEIHDLPPRLKLRINDATSWFEMVTGDHSTSPSDILCPQA